MEGVKGRGAVSSKEAEVMNSRRQLIAQETDPMVSGGKRQRSSCSVCFVGFCGKFCHLPLSWKGGGSSFGWGRWNLQGTSSVPIYANIWVPSEWPTTCRV